MAQAVGEVKKHYASPAFRPDRELQVIRKMQSGNPGPLHGESIAAIWREVMSACRGLEQALRIGYLGPVGTFTEQAVFAHFGHEIQPMPCPSIDEVFRAAEAGTVDCGVVPVENSTEGVVSRTLDLFLQTSLKISGEIALRVHHNLLHKTGDMSQVKVVRAHAQALAQCQRWLNTNYPNLAREAVSSNAEAARMAGEDETVAALASVQAANRYGLHVVRANVEDDPHNRTRFVVIGNYETEPSGRDQTSLILSVPNEAGAVYRLLAPLAENGVSMCRFESRPAQRRVGVLLLRRRGRPPARPAGGARAGEAAPRRRVFQSAGVLSLGTLRDSERSAPHGRGADTRGAAPCRCSSAPNMSVPLPPM